MGTDGTDLPFGFFIPHTDNKQQKQLRLVTTILPRLIGFDNLMECMKEQAGGMGDC